MSSNTTVTAVSPGQSGNSVQRLAEVDYAALAALLQRYGLLLTVEAFDSIPGSYWGEDEAGLLGSRVYARPVTPVHSVLHEACHWICMPPQRRERLDTDAGGDYDEENAVCYLQILLADRLPFTSAAKLMRDMDRWGYSFRLGSARAWFEQDAEDARDWLLQFGIVAASGDLSFLPRTRE